MQRRLTEKERTALKVAGYCNTHLSASQYAKAIGCSLSTVYYWADRGYSEARSRGLVA